MKQVSLISKYYQLLGTGASLLAASLIWNNCSHGGCVATPDTSLGKIAFMLTATTHRHPIYEHLAAEHAWRHFQFDIILLCIRDKLRQRRTCQ